LKGTNVSTTTNAMLGYPDDARLLIVNADDFGMCHSNNAAILQSFTDGIVTSTSLMTPCPWAQHAIRLINTHPHIAYGVHLTIISEMVDYRWGPLTPRSTVPSIIDESGHFFSNDRAAELMERARIDEVETEFRAQINTVLDAGLKPTHLDWHCVPDGGRDDIFELTRQLAEEHGLALRVSDHTHAESVRSSGLPANDHGIVDSFSLATEGKSDTYSRLLRDLPSGLNEWAVHPGLGNAEAQAMEPEGWQVRKADLDFVTSRQARDIIEEEGIILLGYRDSQRLWSR